MWAIVLVSLGMLSGVNAGVVTEGGAYSSRAACQSALKAAVPAKLDSATKAEYQQGYRQYVCVRVEQVQVAR